MPRAVSGAIPPERRRALRPAIDALDAGHVGALVVARLDRATRSLLAWAELVEHSPEVRRRVAALRAEGATLQQIADRLDMPAAYRHLAAGAGGPAPSMRSCAACASTLRPLQRRLCDGSARHAGKCWTPYSCRARRLLTARPASPARRGATPAPFRGSARAPSA